MIRAAASWNSGRLGFAAFLLDALVVVLIFGLGYAGFAGGLTCMAPVIGLALTGFGGARLLRSVDRRRAVSATVWTVLTASALAACLLSIARLPAPPPPAAGEEVSSVLARFGTPEPDQPTSSEYVLDLWVEDFGRPLLYVVHIRDGRVAETEIRRSH